MENKNNGFQIDLKEDIAEGAYANLVILAHSSSEFIFDFIKMMPGMPKANVQSRIILAPEHAKRLLLALNENIEKYELQFGKITLPEERETHPILTSQGEA